MTGWSHGQRSRTGCVLCVCVVVFDLETSTIMWPRPELCRCGADKNVGVLLISKIMEH